MSGPRIIGLDFGRRSFPAMTFWLRTVEAWAETVETAQRIGVSPGILRLMMRNFPAYPEDMA